MRLNKATIYLAFVALGYFGTAKAAWVVVIDGPDVFGDTTVNAVNARDPAHALIIKCDQDTKLQFAYIEKNTGIEDSTEIPVTMLVQVDRTPPVSFDATISRWNDQYAGAVINGKSDELVSLVRSIGNGRDKIMVGLRAGTMKTTSAFDASKTSELKSAIARGCKIPATK